MRSRLDPWRFRTPRLTLRHRIPKRNDRGTEKSSRRMPLRSVRIQLGVGLGKGLEAMPSWTWKAFDAFLEELSVEGSLNQELGPLFPCLSECFTVKNPRHRV